MSIKTHGWNLHETKPPSDPKMQQNGEGERERGLPYIVYKLEQEGLVTIDDVTIFMKDLDLPELGEEELGRKFRAVGAEDLVFYKLPHFFQFVMGELMHTFLY